MPGGFSSRQLCLSGRDLVVRVFHLTPRNDSALGEIPRTRLRDARVLEQRLRARHVGALTRQLGIGGGHRKTNQHVPAGNTVALRMRNFQNLRGLRRRDNELGSGGWRHNATCANHRAQAPSLHGLRGNRRHQVL